jgi:hypothetical protein
VQVELQKLRDQREADFASCSGLLARRPGDEVLQLVIQPQSKVQVFQVRLQLLVGDRA